MLVHFLLKHRLCSLSGKFRSLLKKSVFCVVKVKLLRFCFINLLLLCYPTWNFNIANLIYSYMRVLLGLIKISSVALLARSRSYLLLVLRSCRPP